jgi:RNA polymerase sigma factor (sigma-70 family)
MPALALHSFSKAIKIPASLRDQPLDTCQTSARLTAVLERFGIHVLGDLHGRKVVDFAWEKNCGPKTLYEFDLLARRAQSRNGKASCNGHRHGRVHASHSFSATGSDWATAKMQEDAARFAIPESICHLDFNELPITTRLANVVRSMGARSLGDLHGRSAFELLQYKACGWGTVSEIQQLIERAVSGEFDVGQIEQATVAAELLRLLEQGLAKLPLRDREFVLARIGAQIGGGRSPGADLFCLTYAEIGQRYGLTRARVHKVLAKTLDSLRKVWGPRVPRLLEVIKWRCLSAICPVTPQLLEKWVGSPAAFSSRPTTRDYLNSFRLSMEAYVR